ncbi:hypothetical protein LJC23_07785, partial [Desulfovibrio sp. OttesenSCG-928-I05]|nr:hypothetical protein [Desulfovibrio sp. OttesenSCG-928-I05]
MKKVNDLGYTGLLTLARQGEVRARTHTGAIQDLGVYSPTAWPPFVLPAPRTYGTEPEDVFVALPPAVANGENAPLGSGGEAHVAAAVEAGAAFVLCRPEYFAKLEEMLPGLIVSDESRHFLPTFVEHPSPR